MHHELVAIAARWKGAGMPPKGLHAASLHGTFARIQFSPRSLMAGNGFRLSLLYAIMFCFGILSMGYQQVAARILAPYFGTPVHVWAVLISTFLAAFTLGSFLGGWLSGLPSHRRLAAVMIVGAIGTLWLFIGAVFRKPVLEYLERTFESEIPALMIGCGVLFAAPVIVLSGMAPIAIELIAQTGVHSGKAAGRLYGVSTLGNIAGVFLTAFMLIPNFHMPAILYGWTLTAAVCFGALVLTMRNLWPASS
jgi:MFS family permease